MTVLAHIRPSTKSEWLEGVIQTVEVKNFTACRPSPSSSFSHSFLINLKHFLLPFNFPEDEAIRRWCLMTNPSPTQVMSPTTTSSRRLMSSPSQSPRLGTGSHDDATIGEMLCNAHREHVYHSQREGLSVGQSLSSVPERTVNEKVGHHNMTEGNAWTSM